MARSIISGTHHKTKREGGKGAHIFQSREMDEETYIVGNNHAAFPRHVLREERRLLEKARPNVNRIGPITQLNIHCHHAPRVRACGSGGGGGGHAGGGEGTGGAAAAGDGGGGEEERMDEVGEEAEEEEGAAGHRHCLFLASLLGACGGL